MKTRGLRLPAGVGPAGDVLKCTRWRPAALDPILLGHTVVAGTASAKTYAELGSPHLTGRPLVSKIPCSSPGMQPRYRPRTTSAIQGGPESRYATRDRAEVGGWWPGTPEAVPDRQVGQVLLEAQHS